MQLKHRGKLTVIRPQCAGEYAPIYSHEKVISKYDCFPKRQYVCVCVCLCVCVCVLVLCVQTVGGAGTGDSEQRGMRHCIKL